MSVAATEVSTPSVHTPPPATNPMRRHTTSPESVEKVPMPNHKRRLLLALEAECKNLSDLLQRKRRIVAEKAFKRAREVAMQSGTWAVYSSILYKVGLHAGLVNTVSLELVL